jgi:hypothetical protein
MSDLILPLVVIGALALLALALEYAERSLKAKVAHQHENPHSHRATPAFKAK